MNINKRAYLNYLKDEINNHIEKHVYFAIELQLNGAKIVKISKQKDYFIKFLDRIEDNKLPYYIAYSLPIYKSNFCYVGANSIIGFKSYATQVLKMLNNNYKECY
jgi:hypothetical protein